jgi:SP family myo-inositol transporter-like MFS transporter 13
MYYAATILQMAGFKSNEGSTSVAIIVAATNMVFTIVAVFVIDHVGRRKMLLFTMISMIGGLIALGATFAAQQGFVTYQSTCGAYSSNCARCVLDDRCGWSISNNMCIATLGNENDIFSSASGCPSQSNDSVITGLLLTFLIIYVASYALGLGYIPWLAQSEMFPMSIRGKANGVATAVNWICNLIVSISFLSMTDAMTTAGTFWFYAGVSIVFWGFLIRLMPEVRDRQFISLFVN